ncbi:multidrug efflux SMR transporter [Leuconostocaceae bacterium ESL0958]|nr:multidrug efflux SMR transporter [Leuconostocaceae bacterium ESL0958]
MAYFLLALAVLAETTGTALIDSTDGFTKIGPTLVTLGCYALSFYLLAVVVKLMPVHIAYALWAAAGILIITAVSVLFFKASLNWQTVLGLAFLIVGVFMVNYYGQLH